MLKRNVEQYLVDLKAMLLVQRASCFLFYAKSLYNITNLRLSTGIKSLHKSVDVYILKPFNVT